MSGDDFIYWLEAMRDKGMNNGHCAALLGRGRQVISRFTPQGTDKVTALACAALLAGLQPYKGKR